MRGELPDSVSASAHTHTHTHTHTNTHLEIVWSAYLHDVERQVPELVSAAPHALPQGEVVLREGALQHEHSDPHAPTHHPGIWTENEGQGVTWVKQTGINENTLTCQK